MANFRDPGIIPRGSLGKLEFEKNDQELNLYGNFINLDHNQTQTEEENSLAQESAEDRKNFRKEVPQIY